MFQRSDGEPRTFDIEQKTFDLPDFAEGMQDLYAQDVQILGITRKNAGERTVFYRVVTDNKIAPSAPAVIPPLTGIAYWHDVDPESMSITLDDGDMWVEMPAPIVGSGVAPTKYYIWNDGAWMRNTVNHLWNVGDVVDVRVASLWVEYKYDGAGVWSAV